MLTSEDIVVEGDLLLRGSLIARDDITFRQRVTLERRPVSLTTKSTVTHTYAAPLRPENAVTRGFD